LLIFGAVLSRLWLFRVDFGEAAMLTVQDVQKRYGVTSKTVLGWIHSGELSAINVGRRPGSKKPRWRISEDALSAFEQRRTSSAPPPKMRSRPKEPEVIQFYKE
jgi:excisionase family DNA binding protein